MKLNRKGLVGLLASLSLVGCAWHGEISKDFHRPLGISEEKVPIAVGIIVDPVLMPPEVEYGVSMSYRLGINNYLYALKTQLEHHFESVQFVRDAKDCSSCKLFAMPQAAVQLNQYAGTAVGEMEVLFVNDAGQDVAIVKTARQTNGVLGHTMGSPSSYGEKITRATERVISTLLNDLGKEIKKSPYLAKKAFITPKNVSQTGKLKIDPKYQKYLSSVVLIKTPVGSGSGFFINPTTIITNQHVVEDWAKVEIVYFDGKQALGVINKVDPHRDLALISVSEPNNSFFSLGSEQDVFIGESVIAIGAPVGQEWTLTKGVISQSRNEAGIVKLQTDTAINRGNSGGPLISERTGKVVGVNVSILRLHNDGLPVEGINFAVSVDELKDFLKESY